MKRRKYPIEGNSDYRNGNHTYLQNFIILSATVSINLSLERINYASYNNKLAITEKQRICT